MLNFAFYILLLKAEELLPCDLAEELLPQESTEEGSSVVVNYNCEKTCYSCGRTFFRAISRKKFFRENSQKKVLSLL